MSNTNGFLKTTTQASDYESFMIGDTENDLIAAKKKGHLLVVSITSDKFICKGPDRPIFNDIKRVAKELNIENEKI